MNLHGRHGAPVALLVLALTACTPVLLGSPPDAGLQPDGGGFLCTPLPNPGEVSGLEFIDAEPNDSFERAVPQGVVEGTVWLGRVSPLSTLSSAEDVDLYVFRTGEASTVEAIHLSACWEGADDLVDLQLWSVVGGCIALPIAWGRSDGGSCEVLSLVDGGIPVPFDARTSYVLEVRPGVDFAPDGGPVAYATPDGGTP